MTQARIVDAVARRGYLNGYTPGQIAARQVVKLTEELGELIDCVRPRLSGYDAELWAAVTEHVITAGRLARLLFDGGDWQNAEPTILYGANNEASDMAVVLSVFAGLQGFDLMQAATDKATSDVARGVR